jgi:hypothetical protein
MAPAFFVAFFLPGNLRCNIRTSAFTKYQDRPLGIHNGRRSVFHLEIVGLEQGISGGLEHLNHQQ